MRTLALAVALGVTVLAAPTVEAQNPSLNAAFATVRLTGGFMPDPNVTSLTAGGSITPSPSGCAYGKVASAPDVKLHYTPNGGHTLYIWSESGDDTTLLINMPDGSWRCDDDSMGNRNPIIVIPNASSGRYDIWVGTYGESTASAQLKISEINPRR